MSKTRLGPVGVGRNHGKAGSCFPQACPSRSVQLAPSADGHEACAYSRHGSLITRPVAQWKRPGDAMLASCLLQQTTSRALLLLLLLYLCHALPVDRSSSTAHCIDRTTRVAPCNRGCNKSVPIGADAEEHHTNTPGRIM